MGARPIKYIDFISYGEEAIGAGTEWHLTSLLKQIVAKCRGTTVGIRVACKLTPNYMPSDAYLATVVT